MLVKLRFDQYQNKHKKFKNYQKIEKPAHIVLISRILTTQVDKQGIDTFERKMHVSGVLSQNSKYEV